MVLMCGRSRPQLAPQCPEAKATLLYLGERAEQHGTVAVVPVVHALPQLAELLG